MWSFVAQFRIVFLSIFFFYCISGLFADQHPEDPIPLHLLDERVKDREKMVNILTAYYSIEDEKVIQAMRSVPRHFFVPQSQQAYAYYDQSLPIEYGQTISQPFIVAFMTEILEIDGGDTVLEIGTGSGYQAAVLAEITSHVFTIEIIEPLGQAAQARFQELGYTSINQKIDDGYYGWEEHAPFDAIIVTAAAGHIPPPLIKQLKPGGKLVIPVGPPGWTQILILVTKSEESDIKTKQLMYVRFVPMTGAVQK